jgi:hypothetical protein
MNSDIRELLAGYADGGLSDEETARVDAYLDEHPETRDEVEALRALVAETRAAQPRPREEPAWDDMARAIRAAVDDSAPGPVGRVLAWLRARPLVAGGAAAALAAAVIAVSIAGGGGSTGADATLADADATLADADDTAPDIEDDLALDLELPTLDEAWADGDIVFDLEPDEGFEDMFAGADRVPDLGLDHWDDPAPTDDLAFPDAPVFDTVVDELDLDELEALETLLENS